jgi:hypothetical protein
MTHIFCNFHTLKFNKKDDFHLILCILDTIIKLFITPEKNCALMGYYAVSSGISLLMFWDNLLVPFSRVNHPFFLDSWSFKMGPIGCPKMSVRNYQYLLHNDPEDCSSHLFTAGSLKSPTWNFIRPPILIWTYGGNSV